MLDSEGHDAAASAVSGIYWKYEQWIRNCEAAFDSPVGVYGGFYAVRRELASVYPAGIILDDMFQPLSIVAKGYRSVLDRSAIVVDTWPAKAAGEFQRKVRTLAGNYQLMSLAPWVLGAKNRLWFQLVSHKLMRLVVPYLFVLLLVSATWLGVTQQGVSAMGWRVFAALEWEFWLSALLALAGKDSGAAPRRRSRQRAAGAERGGSGGAVQVPVHGWAVVEDLVGAGTSYGRTHCPGDEAGASLTAE